VRNGSVTPREEGFAKQTQVRLFGEWTVDAVTAEAYPLSIKLEALLERYSWKKVLQYLTVSIICKEHFWRLAMCGNLLPVIHRISLVAN
jgi:hypothetical protein